MTQPTVAASPIDLAREGVYRFLAAAFRDPASAGAVLLQDRACREAAAAAADLLRDSAGAGPRLGFGELPPGSMTLRPVLDCLEDEATLHDEYRRVFGLLPPRECPPYETEYYPTEESFFRAQQLADVAGFYAAFGLAPSHRDPERPDYLPLELEFLAFVLMKKRQAGADPAQAEVCAEAEATFFRDHLAWWLPSFTSGLRHRAAKGPYVALAEFLAALLPLERERFGVPAPKAPLPLTGTAAIEDTAGCAGCAT